MRRSHVVYRFGDFELHPQSGCLLHAGRRIPLGHVQLGILSHLVANAPAVVGREAIGTAGWGGTASSNSIEKAVSRLRQLLGDRTGTAYIQTVPNQGYRFVPPVEEADPSGLSTPDMSDDDEPFRAVIAGLRALPTLNREAIARARRDFERAIAGAPDYAPAHIGLAMACALTFEATRCDGTLAVETLSRGLHHARIAVRLAPRSADARSTLGFVLFLSGDPDAAAVAARKAVALEPGSYRHFLRMAFVSWGETRMEAAQDALTLRPQLGLAHWLRTTVLIARRAFDAALEQLRDGCAVQDEQPAGAPAYPAVGLHLLRGLVLAAQAREDMALAAFDAELARLDDGHIYAHECAANTWYAIGAIRLRQREFSAAEAAFLRALEIAPGHLCSRAALGRPVPPVDGAGRADVAIANAVTLARGNRHGDAARLYSETLAVARLATDGWILPVEPILQPLMRPELWTHALGIVQHRAT